MLLYALADCARWFLLFLRLAKRNENESNEWSAAWLARVVP